MNIVVPCEYVSPQHLVDCYSSGDYAQILHCSSNKSHNVRKTYMVHYIIMFP